MGKSADGLCNNHVDMTFHAFSNHAVEFFTLFGVGAGYAIVSEYSGKLPLLIFLYEIGVMLHLCIITGISFPYFVDPFSNELEAAPL